MLLVNDHIWTLGRPVVGQEFISRSMIRLRLVVGCNLCSLPVVGRVASYQLREKNILHLQVFPLSDGLIRSLFLLLAASAGFWKRAADVDSA